MPGRNLDFSVQQDQAHLLECFVQEFLFLSQQGLVWTSWACPDWTRCLLFLRLLLAGLLLDPLAGWHRTKLWQRTRGFLQTGFSKLSYPPRRSYATHVVKWTPEGEQKLLAKKVGFFKNHYVGITRNEQGQALSDSHATT